MTLHPSQDYIPALSTETGFVLYFRPAFKHLSMESFESGKAAVNMDSLFVREVVHCKKLSANMLPLAVSLFDV